MTTMSSGSLPLSTYHRAQSLGEGTYGSVVAVYNDDGEEFALKLFLKDEDDADALDGIDLGALREISILRLLRHDNGHPNIVPMVDVKGLEEFDEEDCGAGTSGNIAMAMPLYAAGTLADAIGKGVLESSSKRARASLAHQLLSAIAFLHDNGIMHRDIKADNVMMEPTNDDGSGWKLILIDFSLAKLANGAMYHHQNDVFKEIELSHTCEVGTVTYIAPEVYAQEPYSLSSDLWSIGVILLEMIQNRTLQVTKNKEGYRYIAEAKENLPDQPFANLVQRLLTQDPKQRITAREALESSPLFGKFGLDVPPVRIVDIHLALPLEEQGETSFLENVKPTNKGTHKKPKQDPIVVRRQRTIRKLCSELDCQHPMTPYAAFCYSQQMFLHIDDTLDDLSSSQTLLDCVVLASKFFETELRDLNELEEEGAGSFSNWSLEQYYDNEGTIWMLMDHCLYPRGFGYVCE